MKHDLEERLRSGARRELRNPPAGIADAVRARLGEAPVRPAREFPFGLLAGLAAAGLLATAFWPEEPVRVAPPTATAAAPIAPEQAIDWTRRGIAFASRLDRPLADEWQLMVQDSLALYGSLVGQLPKLPR